MNGWSPSLSGMNDASPITVAGSEGVRVTTGAANTKGAWTAIVTASASWGQITVVCLPWSGSVDFMVDISKGDGTVFTILAPDLHIPAFNTFSGGIALRIPLNIQRGTVLYARAAAVGASAQVSLAIRGSAGFWGAPGFSRAVALYTPATQRGVSIDAGATANTKSAWIAMSTGVTTRIGAVMALIGQNAQATRTACSWLWDIGIGVSGSQQVVLANIPLSVATTSVMLTPHYLGPFDCSVPPSTAWWARAQCSITTAAQRTFDLALYGMAA